MKARAQGDACTSRLISGLGFRISKGTFPIVVGERETTLVARSMDSVEQVQVFPWLEANGPARLDWDLRSGAWISSNSGFTGANAEHAKSAQFDSVSRCQGIFHALEHRIDSCFRLNARQACPIRNFVHHILFNQANLSVLDSEFEDCIPYTHARGEFSSLSTVRRSRKLGLYRLLLPG